jgi:hypothetical protein
MIAMREQSKKRLRQSLLACACAVLVSFSAVAAHAADDDDEDTFEQRIIKGILGGMGVNVGGAGIEYRERSPLVLPPSRDLPPPSAAAAANANAQTAAWPRDPDRRARKVAKLPPNTRATGEDPGSSAALTPDELARGTKRGAGRVDERQADVNDTTFGGPRDMKENAPSIFSWRGLMGSSQEQATFSGEPGRATLTQPPSGYQTPSPAQPYGVGTERNGWKVPSLLDRPVGTER